MRVLTIRDGCFPDGQSATLAGDRLGEKPLSFVWNRVPESDSPADFYTDICIPEAPDNGHAVAWLIEPPSMPGKDGHYRWVEENRTAFRAALTYRADLLADPWYRFYPHGGAWVAPIDYAIRKIRTVSIIASAKRLSVGHMLRHDAIARFGKSMHVCGGGYSPIPSKIYGLVPFAYTVVIENWKADYYFTEKLIDAFLTRTVPIYWGCPSIGKFFERRGIVPFDTLDELGVILNSLYLNPAAGGFEKFIEANYQAAQEYVCAEDWIANRYPDLMEP